jgi:hypothetical protein
VRPEFELANLKGQSYFGEVGIDMKIILKWIIEK